MRDLLILTLSLFISSQALAQESVPMDLGVEDAVKYAWENSQKAKTAVIDVEQAKKDVWIQTAKGLPIVKGSFGFNNFVDLPTSIIPAEAFGAPAGSPNIEAQFGQAWTMEAGINVGLQLFDGSYIIGLKAVKGLKKITADQQQMTMNEIKTILYCSGCKGKRSLAG
jgi:outer membrane protein TolC